MENLYTGTTRLIEDELNGAANILSFESASDAFGVVEITAQFQPGTDSSLAGVEVQNRLKRVEARLPAEVRQQGTLVEEASAATLNIITLISPDKSMDEIALGDFLIRNVINEIRRIPGVGRATLYSTERSLRIWIDSDKLRGLSLNASDVSKAITNQNVQIASGAVGAMPSPASNTVNFPIIVKGQMTAPEEFGAIVLRANPDGSNVRLRDIARIELGGEDYKFTTRLNGGEAAGISVTLAPDGNALETASAIRAKMEELSQFFPSNVQWDIPYDITPAVEASIKKVLMTLVEAVILVFVVMFLFLQNIRYTLIPTIVVPIALMGTCTVMLLAGFSVNVLTMFGMVLAIGILVDDAIVVVENVERIMNEEGLSPKEATRKAMSQITGAIIGITLVLIAVFIPMAFFPGSVGIIYRQFSIAMVTSIGFSALLALTLTPRSLRHPPQAYREGTRPFQGRRVRLVQPSRRPGDRALRARCRGDDQAVRPGDDGLSRPRHRPRLRLRADAGRLPAGGGPGLLHRGYPDAARLVVQPHAESREGGGRASPRAARRRHGDDRQRLLVLRPGPGDEPGLRDLEAMG